jgi:PKD repeat protein
MVSRRLLVPAGLLVLLVGILALALDDVVASGWLGSLRPAHALEDLDLQLLVTPEAASPGDQLSLSLTITNRGASTLGPQINIFLPTGISPHVQRLPSGTSYDFRQSVLRWQPLVHGTGGVARLDVELDVSVAQTDRPQQMFRAVLELGGHTRELEQSVWLGLPPRAAVVLDRTQASIGQPVTLRAAATGPGPITQRWMLGDGRVVEAIDPVVVYPAEGTYQVTLSLSNPVGTSTTTNLLEIVPDPAAFFTLADDAVAIGGTVQFFNQSGGKAPLTYHWEFGDGASSDLESPSHVYEGPGVYRVRLTAVNDFGTSESWSGVRVGSAPLAEMLMPPSVDAGQVLRGQALTDATVTEVRWTMGDGRSALGNELQHVFWSGGSFLVTMTAVNDYGETSISHWVEVQPGVLFLFLPLLHVPEVVTFEGEFAGVAADEVAAGSQVAEHVRPRLEPVELPANVTPAESLYVYINEARRLYGLPALNVVQGLNVAAQAHADDMAIAGFTGHTGSNGSTPPYRINRAGYRGGYGGETTAWGIASAVDVVGLWLDSPGHRVILLNAAATDVGVGFAQDFQAPNVWYWTAEFASLNLPVVAVTPLPEQALEIDPVLQLLGPPRDSDIALQGDNLLVFTWSWPLPLADGQRFAVYLRAGGRTYQIGAVRESHQSNQYQYKAPAGNVPAAPGDQFWLVRLEEGGDVLAESLPWPIRFSAPVQAAPPDAGQPALSTPSPTPAATDAEETSPSATPDVTPVPTEDG